MKRARATTAAMTTGSSFGSRLTVTRIGISSKKTEARFNQSSQARQLLFLQRRSSLATRSTVSDHSAVNQSVRAETNRRKASNRKTARASPPRQPIPETTTDESRTAMGFTPFLFHAAHDRHHRRNGFASPRAVRLQCFEGFQLFLNPFRQLPLLALRELLKRCFDFSHRAHVVKILNGPPAEKPMFLNQWW